MKAKIEDDYGKIIELQEELEDAGGALEQSDTAENCSFYHKRKRIRDKIMRLLVPYHRRMIDVHALAATLGEDITSFNEDFYVATPS